MKRNWKKWDNRSRGPGSYWTTSPVAKRGPTVLIFIFTLSPGFVWGTKTTKPSILATPSPRRLVSLISTSYSFPCSTGLLKERSKLMRFTSVFHSASSSGENSHVGTHEYDRTVGFSPYPSLAPSD